MKIKTSELTGAALDWAVAKSVGQPVFYHDVDCCLYMGDGDYTYSPTTMWEQAGPILDGEKIGVWWESSPYADGIPPCWASEGETGMGFGPTPLVAAMRCYVASELGDEIEIPDELKGE